ncbi:MAG: GEVED domain-containing protein [bacterium]|nr:GEVED domain-containing protein [bacterium]
MKKFLLFSTGLVALAILLTAGFTIATNEKPVPGPMSVEKTDFSEPNWELKAQNEITHEETSVPTEAEGRDPVWSDGTHPSDQEISNRLALSESRSVNSYPVDARTSPVVKNGGLPVMLPAADLLSEGFEGGLVPPTGWTNTVNNPYTWESDSYAPYEGTYYASCFYDESYSGTQDEWLISPSIDLTSGGSAWTLSFFWQGSYYWSVDPNPNCDLEVYFSTDGGATWIGPVWDENGIGVFDNWVWYNTTLPLTAYLGETDFKFAFRYAGYDGAQFSIDAITINDGALPTGRCCSGDPTAPSCEDGMYEADCAAIGGTWSVGLNCTENPCPIAGANDECVNAEDATGVYPVQVTGNNIGATIDCPGVLDWNAVWYKIDVPYGCQNVTLDYCGTTPELATVGVVLYPDCSDCNNYVLRTDYAWTTCGDGGSNPQVWWNMLPGPATYYIPVFMGDGVEQEFTFSVNVEECPPAADGDLCDQPLAISITGQEALPVALTNQYTCGRLNYYEETCLGYYDGGEDIVYELTVDNPIDVDITLDPKGTTYTGFLIDATCPADPSTCLFSSTSSSSSPQTLFGVHLDAGTYYVMVDTWPSPDCIPDFDLTFAPSSGPTSGDDCTDPILVKLPDDMPYADLSQKTCGRGNTYSETCLGLYDGGEDIIYSLDVGATMTLDIILDPKGTTYTGISISDACPGATCIDYVTGSSGGPKGFYGITLDPGIYYIMIDTWPSPACVPDFDLTIAEAAGCTDNDCWEFCEEIGNAFEQPFTTIGATPDGPGGCLSSPNIWYCYTATCTGPARVSLCGSSYDTKMAVYDGIDPNTALELGCNDDFCSLQSEVSFDAVAGNSYLIEVGGYSSSTGDGIITIECTDCPTVPPNDNCEDVTPAVLTIGVTTTFTGDNTCATNQCASFPDGHVWEAFTLEQTANVTLDYCGTAPAFGNAWLNLAFDCPCSGFSAAGAFNTSDCGDGNVTIVWEGLAAGTYYYPVLLDPGNGAEGPYTINVLAEELTGPCSASGGCDEYIENVTMGEINNTTACDGYGDYTALSANVEPGSSYPISITIGNGYSSDYGSAWVDWNQDFVFDEVTEAITLDVSSGTGPYTGTVVVPGDAAPGTTVMRVRLNYSSYAGPCGTTTYGEVEDYSIEVAGETGPVWMFMPSPLFTADFFSIDPVSGHIYISEGYTSELGYSAADIDAGSVALVVNGSGISVGVSAVETMPAYGGMPGPICHISFPSVDYLTAEANGTLLYDWVESFFDVTYTYGSGAGTGGLTGSAMIRGHISGDLNMDDAVDVSDLTMLIEYLFGGGDAPLVIDLADVNASGQVDVADLTYFVEFMFNNGPAPTHQ